MLIFNLFRISRLTHSKNSLRPFDQSGSVDRQSNVGGYVPSSLTKRPRSYIGTPLRTPLNQKCNIGGGGGGAGGSTTKTSHTAENEKKIVLEMASYIMEFLKGNPHLRIYLPSGNTLKAMSTKQFVSLVTYLVKGIVSTRLKIGEKYDEDIINILELIKYPHLINKSWLKTPMAMHAYPYMVTLLYWLTERASYLLDVNDFETEDYYLEDDRNSFGDNFHTKMFLKTVKNSFPIWNRNQDDKFELIKLNIIDQNIQRLTEFKSKTEIIKKTMLYQVEYEKHVKNGAIISKENDQDYFKIKMDIDKNEIELKKINLKYNENYKRLDMIKIEKETKDKDLKNMENSLNNLQIQISRQSMTSTERQKAISEFNLKQQLLDSKNRAIIELNDLGISNQIEKSRLIKRKIDLINKYNNYIHTIFHQLQNKKFIINNDNDNNNIVSEKDLCLDPTINIDVYFEELIICINQKLKIIREQNLNDYKQYNIEINDIQNQLKFLENQSIMILQPKEIELNEKILMLRNAIENIDIEIITVNESNKIKCETLLNDKNDIIHQIEKINKQIHDCKENIPNLKIENTNLMNLITDHANKLMDEKEKNIFEIDELLQKFSDSINLLNAIEN